MKKLMILAMLLLGLGLLVSCGEKNETAADTSATTTEAVDNAAEAAHDAVDATAEAAHDAVDATAAAAGDAVVLHDCAGGCGMKDVPETAMVEKDGKWYCAGCAAKMGIEKETAGQDQG
jgi:Na+-transporting methylmalonyl-CoA/oxaloacetate decarboxylase gamma subunit